MKMTTTAMTIGTGSNYIRRQTHQRERDGRER
jgi:hypothetical protein